MFYLTIFYEKTQFAFGYKWDNAQYQAKHEQLKSIFEICIAYLRYENLIQDSTQLNCNNTSVQSYYKS